MTNDLARAAADQDDDAELTTRRLLSSGKRLKASPVTPEVDTPIRVTGENTRLGPYQIVCELASGGMATVYLALYRSVEGFEKLCAVKRIHPHLASEREFTNMFVDEAQIAARISHPFVCSVFSFGRSQRSHFIAMEFLRGEPLSAVTRRIARSPELGDDPRFPAIAARLLANFAEGLHAAHTLRDDRGALLEVVHRDVTPQNLFVLYDGSVRVTDFGIAHARRRLHQTEGQKLKGKLSYVAPEQLNEGKVDLRVDVWGLGVTLWELLAGRRLFLGSSEGETLAAVLSRVVPPPSSFRASVPVELDRIVLRALDRDVQKRYKSARDLARDLERFLTTLGDQVPGMDVADWMATVFPQGAERIQTLIEMAARVSAATADETVVRVPSVPPPAVDEADSFIGPAAPYVSEHLSSLPPTREFLRPVLLGPPASPAPVSADPPREAEAQPTALELPPARAAMASKPRLILVEETTQALASPEPGRALQRLVLLSALLLGLGIGAYVLHARTQHLAAAPERVTPAAAVQPARRAEAPAAADLGQTEAVVDGDAPALSPPLAAVGVADLPLEVARKVAAVPKSAPAAPSAKAEPAPASAVLTGVVFVTTPGTRGEVYEQGALLGSAPGTFRLSVGTHQLSVQTPSGATQSLQVEIKHDAPTLVTVNAAP